jgi:hypothetical protein
MDEAEKGMPVMDLNVVHTWRDEPYHERSGEIELTDRDLKNVHGGNVTGAHNAHRIIHLDFLHRGRHKKLKSLNFHLNLGSLLHLNGSDNPGSCLPLDKLNTSDNGLHLDKQLDGLDNCFD